MELSEHWYVGGWMTTEAACLSCLKSLPAAWQRLFECPKLEDYIQIEKLGESEQRGTETWLVERPNPKAAKE